MFLTPDELATLTGSPRKSVQVEYLRSRRIRHYVNRRGEAVVAWAWLDVGDKATQKPPNPDEPWLEDGIAPVDWLEREFMGRFHLPQPMQATGPWPDGNITGGGIYFLFDKSGLVYVGQTVDFQWRLSEHDCRFPFNGVATMRVPMLLRDAVEAFYIEREKPIYNAKFPRVPDYVAKYLTRTE
jgi:hypothetical protein